ncbi:hypothetical protein GCM10011378_25890 [Hymenobacter glacieicola]|uniref:Curlin-associated protein n=2 Tax=Hymenobacter glacieicola TaxID=1562124 RepID=A0ABQ1WWQ3_9BACT|nr:hypothetical protein GCM10011378_25890 [Hymenobacter glacieicola]
MGNNNSALARQLSGANVSTQTQSGTDHVAEVFQSGSEGNTATQTQSGSFQKGYITQLGSGNTATQNQRGFQDRATITQLGLGNTATQAQGGNPTGSWYSVASIEQIGNSNIASQTQQHDYQNATIEQSGNGSTAIQNQSGVDFVEPGNRAYIDQDDMGGHFARQTQVGIGNQAATYQGMSGNSSDVMQSGNNNVSVVKQNHP